MGVIQEMNRLFPQTHIWCDSCAKETLEWGIEKGIVGATTNPVIVGKVLKEELPLWEDQIKELFSGQGVTEDDVAWELIKRAGLRGADLLLPIYKEKKGTCGKISIQTNIKYYRNTNKMVQQAVDFSRLADNIQVKIPASKEGIMAIEEATYQGVSINATVCFSAAQAVQVAKAVERGLQRREQEGLFTAQITPICTIMVGRINDWLKTVVQNNNIMIDPECLEWAGIAVFKHTYDIFQKEGYRTKLLTAAYRNHYSWSAFLGGDISMTMPRYYLEQIENSDILLEETMSKPVDENVTEQLLSKLLDFKRVYEKEGMAMEEFNRYGAFITCLQDFFQGYENLLKMIRPYQFGKAL